VEHLQPADVRQRADELITGWRNRPIRTSGAALGEAALNVAHYVPYLLATIYYSTSVLREIKHTKEQRDLVRIQRLWIDEIIDRVMQFAPLCDVSEEGCRDDLTTVVSTLTYVLGNTMIQRADVVSNGLFSVLQKRNSKVGERERGLIHYIVRAELRRLSHAENDQAHG